MAAVLPRVRGPLFCGATTRSADRTDCRRPAGWGTNHPGWGRCKLHAGSSPNHVESAAMQQAKATARIFAVPREVHPLDGMMECYWRTAGVVDAIEAICSQLLPDEMVWGLVEEKTGADGGTGEVGESPAPPERKYGAGVNTWIKLFGAERDRMFREGEAILKLDLASRQVELAQSQVSALVQVLLSPDLGLSQDQLRVAARLLRGLERSAAPAIEGTAA